MVLVPQPEVEDRQLETLAAQGVQRAGAVLQPVHGVAFGFQCGANAFAQGLIVFDEKNAHLGKLRFRPMSFTTLAING